MVGKQRGFTIVELLIVIVVIAILAAISVTAYNGIQQRARDSQRASDTAMLTKALELFYIDNGRYPQISGSGSTTINAGWSTTADSSWTTANAQTAPFYSSLTAALVPKYLAALPRDPISTQGVSILSNSNSYGYAYFGSYSSGYCGKPDGQVYILVYRNEQAGIVNQLGGTCNAPALGPYGAGASNTRTVKE